MTRSSPSRPGAPPGARQPRLARPPVRKPAAQRPGLLQAGFGAALLASALVGAKPLLDQVLVVGAASAARQALGAGELAPLRRWEGLCPGPCPVAVLTTGAAVRTSLAVRAPAPQRHALLQEAQVLLDAAIAREPQSSQAQILLVRLRVLQDLGPSPRLQAALRQAYQLQPFSAEAGLWRVGLVGGYWPLLPQDLRARAIDEARWRWSIHADERPAILAALPNPQARAALQDRITAVPLRPY